MTFDPTDPFGLRRFGFYSEQDVELTRLMYEGCVTEAEAWQRMGPEVAPSLSLDTFLRYWTPERLAQRKREECRG